MQSLELRARKEYKKWKKKLAIEKRNKLKMSKEKTAKNLKTIKQKWEEFHQQNITKS